VGFENVEDAARDYPKKVSFLSLFYFSVDLDFAVEKV